MFLLSTLYFFCSLFFVMKYTGTWSYIIHVLYGPFSFLSLVLWSWIESFSFRPDGGWRGVLWWGLVGVEKKIQATRRRGFATLLLLICIYCCPTSWQSWNWIRRYEVCFSSHASYMQVHIKRSKLVGVSYQLRTSLCD